MRPVFTRRKFLAASALAVGAPAVLTARNANEKLNVAVIGVSNRGAANLAGVAHENVVALCDVDPDNAKKAREQFPKAEFFTDYRQMFDKAAKTFDAVVVSTPDHTHALPACIAMSLGKHVYCEKPMAETVAEVRHMRALAAKQKVVTQMGTQIHAENNYRRVVEIVQAGLLGEVKKVHVWNSSRPVGGKKLSTKPAAKFDLDLWMGPTTGEFFEVAVNPSSWKFAWPHFHWRWWWNWGGGTLADLGCHYIDLPYWALGLTSPTKAVATGQVTYTGDNTTPDMMRADYTFPDPKGGAEIALTWEHGVSGPDGGKRTFKGFGSGILFVGTKGQLVSDYGKYLVLPEAFAKDFKAPEKTIKPSIGHHKEWTEACKGNGGAPLCNFEYAGRLAEAVLLGNVAYRAGKTIAWDHAKGTTGDKAADVFLSREYRKGWELPK
ncbi:MAG: Gfo/Idh/MocA family oxidoreductase [Planctomycetes bacterium]|nr:Gfo/Idh/MocA family oxidoreductase [Planctomycetota bacterium]